jgi:DNA-binding transcriptional MerR regulator
MRLGRLGRDEARACKGPLQLRRGSRGAGLLPAPARPSGGFREHGEEAAARLGFIRAQAVGLRLGEIREVVAFRDRGDPPAAGTDAPTVAQRRGAW